MEAFCRKKDEDRLTGAESMKIMTSNFKGTIYVLISAILFSLGGVLIKMIPWSPLSIQGGRSIFSFFVIAIYMFLTKQKFTINKSVLFGAMCNTIMALTFVAATRMTTAANAIVLQFTEPIFVILLLWIIYRKKPNKEAVIACVFVFAGILCFFFGSLGTGGMIGNILAIVSGLAYAMVFMMKKFPGANFESSILISNVISILLGIPSYCAENEKMISIWGYVILLGIFQCGLSYVFLSKGLDCVSPVVASLTSTIEPILNPVLVALVCGEKIGTFAIIGAILVVGTATIYNVIEAKKG